MAVIRPPEYVIWQAMKSRCYNPKVHNYKYYGGRGISVCADWILSFEDFYRDMGPRPSDKHSIDRIDNNGDYTPSNCRWATQTEQRNNRRPEDAHKKVGVRIKLETYNKLCILARKCGYIRGKTSKGSVQKFLDALVENTQNE